MQIGGTESPANPSMDALAQFLPTAQWQQTGQNTYFCTDPGLDGIWMKFAASLPPLLNGYGLQAWKTTGRTMTQGPDGYIVPVLTISGEPRIENGPSLTPESGPVGFKQGDIISGFLYYVVALPPSTNDK